MAIKDRFEAIRSLWNLLFCNEQKCYAVKTHGIYYNIICFADRTMEVKWGNFPYKGDITVSNSILCKKKSYQVIAVGESAFEECREITSVTILDGVRRIGSQSFRNCERLNYVNMPQSITSIGKAAFLNCSSLKEFCIPENIVSIGGQAFNGCTNLSQVYLRSATPPVCESDAFDPITYFICTLHVPLGAANAYRKDCVWGRFFTIQEKNDYPSGENILKHSKTVKD